MWTRRLTTLFACLVAAACAPDAVPVRYVPVELRIRGDDGYTQELELRLNAAFRESSNFTLSYGMKPGALIVTIPNHVAWNQVGTRTRISYMVEFTSTAGEDLGKNTGSCWKDAMSECAAHIVSDAEKAVRIVR
jgi:hypothetical protein